MSRVIDWIDYRLPIFAFLRRELNEYPAPENLNYLWNFGSLSGIVLVLMIVTGIVLAMHYTPTTADAFDSVEHIMRDANYDGSSDTFTPPAPRLSLRPCTSTSCACILLGRIAIGDWLTVLIAVAAVAALFRCNVSNPLLIAVTAVVGLMHSRCCSRHG
jgi:Cytochrome b/b6/petB